MTGADVRARLAAAHPDASMPVAYADAIARAASLVSPKEAERLLWFTTQWMPEQRQVALASPWLDHAVDGPRVAEGLARLRDLCEAAGVPAVAVDTRRWRDAVAPTFFGGMAPPVAGYPAALAALDDTRFDGHVASTLLHELAHMGPRRAMRLPPPLDECIAGWIGARCVPETCWPREGEDGAHPGALWTHQVGVALVARFGVRAVVRCQAGLEPLEIADAAWVEWERQVAAGEAGPALGRYDQPERWLQLIGALPDDPEADLEAVSAAVRAMCVVTTVEDGLHRVRRALPDAPVVIDAASRRLYRPSVDDEWGRPPSWWLPASVCKRWPRSAHLRLDELDAVDAAATAIAQGRPGPGEGFTILPA